VQRHSRDNVAIAPDAREIIAEFSRNPCGSATSFIDAIVHRCASLAVVRRAEQTETARADSESRILATKLFLGEFAFPAAVARHGAIFGGFGQSRFAARFFATGVRESA
jgi:hypothetical protein